MAPFILPTGNPNLPTTTPFQPDPLTATPVPTETSTATAIPPTATSLPTSTSAPAPTAPPTSPSTDNGQPSSNRTHYTFYLTLDYNRRLVAVNENVRYINITGNSLNNIVFAVEPNLWTDCFSLTSLTQDGAPVADYALSGQRLTVSLAQQLDPGGSTSFDIGYSLSLPVKASNGTFGYTSSQENLTDWYPFIVPYAGDWLLHDTYPFGEELVYDPADYDVNLKVTGTNVVVAASALPDSTGDTTHYHMEAARTFVLSASDSYKVDDSAVGPIQIRSYYFAGDENASKAVVWMATQSIALYQAKFAPYPYQSISVVESALPDGQEYDGLVFVSSQFYSDYNGSARSNLVTIGTHEIAHQWWFGLVGSDQAMEPWLDEALSVYSERIFYEYNYPAYGDWWWNFRVNFFGPTGYVDSSVYDFATFRGYVDAVYLNGANFLDELRSRMGDEAFFATLKDYAARYSHGRATTAGFFAVVRDHTKKDFSDIMQTYFQGQY